MRKVNQQLFLIIPCLVLLILFSFMGKQSQAQLEGPEEDAPVISMDFQDANLKDVLKVFSQQAGLNFIASENVKDRKVTLYLDAVSVEDALNSILSANRLTYEQEEGSRIFVVKEWGKPEIETMTKVFTLQYARVAGYELTVTGEKRQDAKKIGLKEIIEKIVTEHGRVIEDSRTNSLIVTDVPSQFDKIEETISELDIKLPQVMIEAEVIETSLEAIDRLGIEWGSPEEGELAAAFGAGRTSTFPFTKQSGSSRIGQGGTVSDLEMNLGYISAMDLGGTLAMLAKDTDSKILARPRILTLNNETAEIKITADTAISSLTETSSAEGIATQTITAERVETGVSLKVTPQVNNQGEITMIIEPAVINTKQSPFFSEFVDPKTRTVKTTVTVRNGDTVIIGGLIDTEDTKVQRKVPFFGDIPLLGALFQKKDDSVTDTEVVIFITPHLVEEGAAVKGLALETQAPWEYGSLGLEEEAMERFLDSFEE